MIEKNILISIGDGEEKQENYLMTKMFNDRHQPSDNYRKTIKKLI